MYSLKQFTGLSRWFLTKLNADGQTSRIICQFDADSTQEEREEVLRACNSRAGLVTLANQWDARADQAEKMGEASADEKNWSDAQSNMANATAYAQCAADLRAALKSATA